MRNAQGNYNQGRGPDGLGIVGSRFGVAVPIAARPSRVGGRSHAIVDRALPGDPKRRRSTFAPAANYARPRGKPRKISRAQKVRHRRQFVNWIKRWAPGLYSDAKAKADLVERSEGTLAGLSGWWDTFSESITDLGGKYVQFRTQKDILDAQMERMRMGLPPLQTSEYAPTVAVKPDAGTTREITTAIGSGISSLLPWLLIGTVGVIFLTRKKGR